MPGQTYLMCLLLIQVKDVLAQETLEFNNLQVHFLGHLSKPHSRNRLSDLSECHWLGIPEF